MKQFTSTRLFAVTSVVAAMLAAGCSEENNEPSGNASNAAIVTASIGKTDNVCPPAPQTRYGMSMTVSAFPPLP